MKKISTAQIKALRQIHEGRYGVLGIRQATLESLIKRGLLDSWYALTATGKRWIEDYIERTGDGPEDLKAMFRFG